MTVQLASDPVHPPVQPPNIAPGSGLAIKVTAVPTGTVAVHVSAHASGSPTADTLPVAAPLRLTVIVAICPWFEPPSSPGVNVTG
jgi:hypothetical protein